MTQMIKTPRRIADELHIVLRNLGRSRSRTLFALLAIAFGVVSLILAGGFVEWTYWAMREAAIQTGLGHIQVSRTGYREIGTSDPYRYLLPEPSAEASRVERLSEVRAIAPRLQFSGLISHGDTSISFIGEGVDPEKEEQVSKVLLLTAGEKLSVTEPYGVMLGKGLAEALGVAPGDIVVVLATTATGGINAIELPVRGVMTTQVKAYDDVTIRLPIAAARKLIRVSGSHLWVLALQDTTQTAEVVDRLKAQLDGSSLEVRSWLDLADSYRKAVALFSRQMFIVEAIIGLIIVLSISNTLVMGVLERTGEIGTIMALGARRRSVVRLFLLEGLMLGLVGAAIGVATGVVLAYVISAVGIPMPPPPGRDAGYRAEIIVTASIVFTAFLLAIVSTALASIFPARKAARLVIVDALRRNR